MTTTPEPWKIESTEGGQNGPHLLIASPSGYIGHFYPDGNPNADDDGRLIGAAADLLAALRLAEEALERPEIYTASPVAALRITIQAAIAKATSP